MVRLLLICSLLLIGVGLTGYFGATPDPEKGRSVTALIPSFIGVAMLLAGLVSLKESLRKHGMHVAAAVSLIGLLGVLGRLPKAIGGYSENPDGPLVLGVFVATALILLVFLVAAIRSFVVARLLKKKQPEAPPAA